MRTDLTSRNDHSEVALDCDDRDIAIHPSVIMQGDVQIAEGVRIGPYSVLTGPLIIESNCEIGAMCIIGGSPEHRVLATAGRIKIGQNTTIRDGCVIHHGTTPMGTTIGNRCYIMSRSYIAHDCQLADDVTISAGCCLGGHCVLHSGANLGMNVTVHQYSTIGAWAMVGMATPVAKDVPPLSLVAGNPMRLMRCNQRAIDNHGLQVGDIHIQGSANNAVLCYPSDNEKIRCALRNFRSDSRRPMLFEPQTTQPRFTEDSPRKPR